MKRILFFCLIIAGTIFGMEMVDQHSGQDVLRFETTKEIFENLIAFYNLSQNEVINIAMNASTESENSVFNAVILWAFKNCRNADDLKNLLLTIRFQDLDESFIDHVVKKTHLLFPEQLFSKEQYLEQKVIVSILKDFHLLAKKSKYETAEIVLEAAEKFGYKQLLPESRTTGVSAFSVSAMFHGMDKWHLGVIYPSAPAQYFGYHFLLFLVLEQTEDSSSIIPIVNVKCRSEILFKITKLYTEEELNTLSIQEGEEIDKISMPVSLSLAKLFSQGISTKAFLHYLNAEFASIRGTIIRPLPMTAPSFTDALAAPISSADVSCIKSIVQLVATGGGKEFLRTKINDLDVNSFVRARILALFDKEDDLDQKQSITFSIHNELAAIFNNALIEQHSDDSLTLGLWLRIRILRTKKQNNAPAL